MARNKCWSLIGGRWLYRVSSRDDGPWQWVLHQSGLGSGKVVVSPLSAARRPGGLGLLSATDSSKWGLGEGEPVLASTDRSMPIVFCPHAGPGCRQCSSCRCPPCLGATRVGVAILPYPSYTAATRTIHMCRHIQPLYMYRCIDHPCTHIHTRTSVGWTEWLHATSRILQCHYTPMG